MTGTCRGFFAPTREFALYSTPSRPYLAFSETAASAGSSSAWSNFDWWRSHEMRRFPSASALIGASKPDIPVVGLRPYVAERAARWFIEAREAIPHAYVTFTQRDLSRVTACA